MNPVESAALRLQDLAVLWSVGECRAADVVDAACDALVAGLDSPGLRVLAACTRAEADYDVHDLLPPALDELGLVHYPFGDEDSAPEAAARALARRMLAGESTPREFARRVHARYGHGPALTERVAELDDEYDVVEYGNGTAADIDAEVIAEARRLAAVGVRGSQSDGSGDLADRA
ncbi:hypothetical protein ACGFMM_32295 [Streptomyces sp. NPDC048604]|uniref:hypothetical protein n=1 Tax=Streptomyces sp. NPDC048604 TaxID=3365578 RepID=UPI003714D170